MAKQRTALLQNHSPSIIKYIRISDLSYNKRAFNKARPTSEKALKSSNYSTHILLGRITLLNNLSQQLHEQKKEDNLVQLSFSKIVQTGKTFLTLVKVPAKIPQVPQDLQQTLRIYQT